MARRVRVRLHWTGLVANGVGGLTLFLFIAFLLPKTVDQQELEELLVPALALFVPYMVITLPLGRRWTLGRYDRIVGWLYTGRDGASTDERELVLRFPRFYAGVAAFFWTLGTIGFIPLAASLGVGTMLLMLGVGALASVTACALQYLLVERAIRPVTARALAGEPPPSLTTPGVATRLTNAWLVATGVPLLGALAVGVADVKGADFEGEQVVGSMLFLVLLALVLGLLATVVAARSVADPVTNVGRALEQVEQGDFSAHVPVDDGSEVGLLQARFNRMVGGLAERERLHDLFGRHVGRDVAEVARAGEVRLGGELRHVAVLFVDLVGSTGLAGRLPPDEVVGILNGFFQHVVECAERNGGWVNKFEGDAALCVFGAPVALEDCAGNALRAARELRGCLGRELEVADAGIGVSAGPAVAGNVGALERFEYTVIGDPVNEAARLCELAKTRPERLLASDAAVRQATPGEAEHWTLGDAITLRGRNASTRLATAAAA